MDHPVPATGPTEHLLASCHTVPIPCEVAHGFLTVQLTHGHATVNVGVGGEVVRHDFRPLSPLYDLNNAGSAGTVVIPTPESRKGDAVISLSCFNDSGEDGQLSVIAGASFAVPKNQPKVQIHRNLPKKTGTSVVVVFQFPC